MTDETEGGRYFSFLDIVRRGELSVIYITVRLVLRDLANVDEPLANPPVLTRTNVLRFRQLVVVLWVLFISMQLQRTRRLRTGSGGRVK